MLLSQACHLAIACIVVVCITIFNVLYASFLYVICRLSQDSNLRYKLYFSFMNSSKGGENKTFFFFGVLQNWIQNYCIQRLPSCGETPSLLKERLRNNCMINHTKKHLLIIKMELKFADLCLACLTSARGLPLHDHLWPFFFEMVYSIDILYNNNFCKLVSIVFLEKKSVLSFTMLCL